MQFVEVKGISLAVIIGVTFEPVSTIPFGSRCSIDTDTEKDWLFLQLRYSQGLSKNER